MKVIQGHNQKLLPPRLDSFIQLATLIRSQRHNQGCESLNVAVKSIVVFWRRAGLQFSSLKFQIVLLYANKAANPPRLTGIYEFNKKIVCTRGSEKHFLFFTVVLKLSWIHFTLPKKCRGSFSLCVF